ncbi:hypothetical protein ABKN59_008738 [Abortiporus biennis]
MDDDLSLISKPPGSPGRDWKLAEGMRFDLSMPCQSSAYKSIQDMIHILVRRVLDVTSSYSKQDKGKLDELRKEAAQQQPILARYKKHWATNYMVQQYLQNLARVRKNKSPSPTSNRDASFPHHHPATDDESNAELFQEVEFDPDDSESDDEHAQREIYAPMEHVYASPILDPQPPAVESDPTLALLIQTFDTVVETSRQLEHQAPVFLHGFVTQMIPRILQKRLEETSTFYLSIMFQQIPGFILEDSAQHIVETIAFHIDNKRISMWEMAIIHILILKQPQAVVSFHSLHLIIAALISQLDPQAPAQVGVVPLWLESLYPMSNDVCGHCQGGRHLSTQIAAVYTLYEIAQLISHNVMPSMAIIIDTLSTLFRTQGDNCHALRPLSHCLEYFIDLGAVSVPTMHRLVDELLTQAETMNDSAAHLQIRLLPVQKMLHRHIIPQPDHRASQRYEFLVLTKLRGWQGQHIM